MTCVLSKQIETVLLPVWEISQALEDKTKLKEAAHRMVKSQQSKTKGGKSGAVLEQSAGENLPGLQTQDLLGT